MQQNFLFSVFSVFENTITITSIIVIVITIMLVDLFAK